MPAGRLTSEEEEQAPRPRRRRSAYGGESRPDRICADRVERVAVVRAGTTRVWRTVRCIAATTTTTNRTTQFKSLPVKIQTLEHHAQTPVDHRLDQAKPRLATPRLASWQPSHRHMARARKGAHHVSVPGHGRRGSLAWHGAARGLGGRRPPLDGREGASPGTARQAWGEGSKVGWWVCARGFPAELGCWRVCVLEFGGLCVGVLCCRRFGGVWRGARRGGRHACRGTRGVAKTVGEEEHGGRWT